MESLTQFVTIFCCAAVVLILAGAIGRKFEWHALAEMGMDWREGRDWFGLVVMSVMIFFIYG